VPVASLREAKVVRDAHRFLATDIRAPFSPPPTCATLAFMKVILQRVTSASVTVDGSVVGQIGRGLVLLVGFGKGDNETNIAPMIEKICKLRIFENEAKKFDKDIIEAGGEVLAISQFTLFADTSKGRRPDFFQALEPQEASRLFDLFVGELRATPITKVATGVFGAKMQVSLTNDGPVTITLER
jgi:D-tyrosyl-tRNA(Tyr) deacylase